MRGDNSGEFGGVRRSSEGFGEFRLWTVPAPSMLPGAALSSLRARFGAPPLDAARRSTLEPRGSFLLAGGSTSGSGRCPSAFRGPPPWMLPGAALWSLAARFCWQGQHFRLWTVPERVSGPPAWMLPGAALWSLLDAARRSTLEPRGSFLLAGAALQALDGARARFGAPPQCCQAQHFRASRLVSADRGSTSGSDGARARFGALWTVPERVSGPPPEAQHFRSLAARFCWQGQHFRLWTVPERVSEAQHF